MLKPAGPGPNPATREPNREIDAGARLLGNGLVDGVRGSNVVSRSTLSIRVLNAAWWAARVAVPHSACTGSASAPDAVVDVGAES